MIIPEINQHINIVTQRIISRSRKHRQSYVQKMARMRQRPPLSNRGGCANLAHAAAVLDKDERESFIGGHRPHIGVVTAYNDMLSAHQPYAQYPKQIVEAAKRYGGTMQVAGAVPAMCDGITQGTPSMELSLFSRDVIAQATAVALSHDVFDGALLLGICDKIVPGLLIGALHFGHLPMAFVPAGPMSSGLPNKEKAKVREAYAQGKVTRPDLQIVESAAYHSPGTCTFYGTANSNQLLLEAMGLHVPGAAFAHPDSPERLTMTDDAVRTLLNLTQRPAEKAQGIGELVDERCIVNAMVALLATGGSTNHLIHWVAVARSAGILINWDDFSDLSKVVPLIARIYPSGGADINQFHAAGGVQWVLRELMGAGLIHADVLTINEGGMLAQAGLTDKIMPNSDSSTYGDESIVRTVAEPFSPTGGISILRGNLGRAVIKVSAVPDDRQCIEAPAKVFDSQSAFQDAFKRGELEQDAILVVRFQGPSANGMPELHKLMPPLAVLQDKGFRVALLTDGRLSGASGKAPAAIHLYPEAMLGGPIARICDGDLIRLDAENGELSVLTPEKAFMARTLASPPKATEEESGNYGRELFAGMRRNVLTAEEGACSWL